MPDSGTQRFGLAGVPRGTITTSGEGILERFGASDILRPSVLPLGLTVDEVVIHELYVLTHANGRGPLAVKLVELLTIDSDTQKVTFCEPGGRVEEWSLGGVGLVAYHGGWNPTNRLVTPATWLEQNPDPATLTEKAAALHRLLTEKL